MLYSGIKIQKKKNYGELSKVLILKHFVNL